MPKLHLHLPKKPKSKLRTSRQSYLFESLLALGSYDDLRMTLYMLAARRLGADRIAGIRRGAKPKRVQTGKSADVLRAALSGLREAGVEA